jgi:hypothetical protein
MPLPENETASALERRGDDRLASWVAIREEEYARALSTASVGAMLGFAADLADDAFRTATQSILLIEAAGERMVDVELLRLVEFRSVDLHAALGQLLVLAENAQKAADAFGHRECRGAGR